MITIFEIRNKTILAVKADINEYINIIEFKKIKYKDLEQATKNILMPFCQDTQQVVVIVNSHKPYYKQKKIVEVLNKYFMVDMMIQDVFAISYAVKIGYLKTEPNEIILQEIKNGWVDFTNLEYCALNGTIHYIQSVKL